MWLKWRRMLFFDVVYWALLWGFLLGGRTLCSHPLFLFLSLPHSPLLPKIHPPNQSPPLFPPPLLPLLLHHHQQWYRIILGKRHMRNSRKTLRNSKTTWWRRLRFSQMTWTKSENTEQAWILILTGWKRHSGRWDTRNTSGGKPMLFGFFFWNHLEWWKNSLSFWPRIMVKWFGLCWAPAFLCVLCLSFLCPSSVS